MPVKFLKSYWHQNGAKSLVKFHWCHSCASYLLRERNHIMKACRDVSFEFIQEGYEVIWHSSVVMVKRMFHGERVCQQVLEKMGLRIKMSWQENKG